MLNYSWETRHDRCKFYFSFWDIYCPATPLTTKKIQIKKKTKKEKATWRYHYFTHVYKNFKNCDHMINGSWNMVRDGRTDRQTDRQIDRQTDGQKKWHIEIGVPTKKFWQVWKSPLQFSQNFGHITF